MKKNNRSFKQRLDQSEIAETIGNFGLSFTNFVTELQSNKPFLTVHSQVQIAKTFLVALSVIESNNINTI